MTESEAEELETSPSTELVTIIKDAKSHLFLAVSKITVVNQEEE